MTAEPPWYVSLILGVLVAFTVAVVWLLFR